MSRLPRLLALPLATCSTLLLAGAVLAVPPTRSVDKVDVTFDVPEFLCGFPLVQQVSGTFRLTEFRDAEGQPVRILDTGANVRITITNPATTLSVTTVQASTVHVTLHDDGSQTIVLTGLQGHLKDPDGGFIREDVGRLVIFVPNGGPEMILSQTGQWAGGPWPDLCDLLV